MKVAINTQALKMGYRIQGTGNYVRHLVDGLKKRKDDNEYCFYTDTAPSKVDVTHIPYFSPYQRTLPLVKHADKIIVTVHDLIPVIFHEFFPPGVKGSLIWYLQKYLLASKVDHIITDSEATREDVIGTLGIPEERVTVVYLAADEKFKPLKVSQKDLHRELREKYDIPEEFVLYVGDILWSKNVPALIEAIQEINVSLLLVGKQVANKNINALNPWNKDLKKVQKMIEKDRRIYSLGYVSDEELVKLYNMAAVYCQPSHYEGFGLPVLEAMACGCPVVVSDRGSLPEIVGEAGVYVDPADVRSIADGVGEIYFNHHNYKKYGGLGLQQSKKFSWEKAIRQTIDVYNKVLKI